MKERAALILPYAIAAVLPLAGLILAVLRFAEGRRYDAGLLVAAAALGTLIYLIILGS